MKNGLNGKLGTMLFSQERRKLKITPSEKAIFQRKSIAENRPVKNCINGARVERYVPGKEKTVNRSVKNSINGTQGTMLFSKERRKLKSLNQK